MQTRDAPDAAILWPAIIGSVTGALWIAVVVKFLFLNKIVTEGAKVEVRKILVDFTRPGLILVGSIGYLLVISWIGFTVSNFMFMVIVFRGLGSTRWLTNILVAAGIAAFLHLALIVLMKLSLPQLNMGPLTI